jgi:hypothetical protein
MMKLAFYTGPGDWTDRLIRTATRSRYSHVELFEEAETTAEGALCVSASKRDGGVRVKRIGLRAGHWDILPVGAWAPRGAFATAARHAGARYDLLGAVFSPWFTPGFNGPLKWFCSELLAYALGFPKPHTISPGDLWDGVTFVNREVRA